MNICVIYIDDLIIVSRTFEEHFENLEKVVNRLKSWNLKLAPEKCHLFCKRVSFLGHVVSSKGPETDPRTCSKQQRY